MARSRKIAKRDVNPDPLYGSKLIAQFINKVMVDGKKSVARKQVYKSFDVIREKTGSDPLLIFRTAIENAKPAVEVRPRRIGGAAYQVPAPVRGDRRQTLAIRWLVNAANDRSNNEYHSFGEKLAAEFIDAANNAGNAIKKKETTHRMAEANQAFAHLRW